MFSSTSFLCIISVDNNSTVAFPTLKNHV